MSEQPSKRSRVDDPTPSYADIIYSVFINMHNHLPLHYNPKEIELEIRFGILTVGSKRIFPRNSLRKGFIFDEAQRKANNMMYKAGVDETYAKNFKSKLPREKFEAKILPVQRLLIKDRERAEFINDKQVSKERKEKIFTIDVSLPSHDYDLRVSCSQELPQDVTSSADPNSPDWEMERIKKRTSFTSHDPGLSIWKIDYTEVATTYLNSHPKAGEKEYEYEIELELNVHNLLKYHKLDWFSNLRNEEREHGARFLTTKLLELIDQFIPSLHDTSGEAVLTPVPSYLTPYYTEQVIDMNRTIKSETRANHLEFLGSMPINLYRSSLDRVQSMDYFVTEKSDGVRYLLYIIPLGPDNVPEAIFMDRSKTFFTLPCSKVLGKLLKSGTILDGEIVFNLTQKKSVFLVFDILSWNNVSLINHKFATRIDFVNKTVVPYYNNHLKLHINDETNTDTSEVLLIIKKRFLFKQDIGQLLDSIKTNQSGERIYKDSPNRHHLNDGIIFQPNTPYVFSRYYDLLKWKWPDLRSIDVIISFDSNGNNSNFNISSFNNLLQSTQRIDFSNIYNISASNIFLSCSGPDRTSINLSKRGSYNVSIGQYDTYRLLAELEELHNDRLYNNKKLLSSPYIAEVKYDIKVGKWSYVKLRSDKVEPNYIDTVLGVFTEQAESINEKELEYQIISTSNNLENDYDRKINEANAHILEYRKKKISQLPK